MMKSRFAATQVDAILKQAEGGTPVTKLCEEHRISHVTFYRWRRKAKAAATSSPVSKLPESAQSQLAPAQ